MLFLCVISLMICLLDPCVTKWVCVATMCIIYHIYFVGDILLKAIKEE